MKTNLLICSLLLVSSALFGQKNTYHIGLHTGLLAFTGQSSSQTSFINYSELSQSGYTNNPYGSAYGSGMGISAELKRITKHKMLLGINLAYEKLRSKVLLTSIAGYTGNATYEYQATGQTYLNFSSINFHPFIGYRFAFKNWAIDLRGGLAWALCLEANEKADARASNGLAFTTNVERKKVNDLRTQLQLDVSYKKIGTFVSYAAGQVNYHAGMIGGVSDCYAKVLRFGVNYQLNERK